MRPLARAALLRIKYSSAIEGLSAHLVIESRLLVNQDWPTPRCILCGSGESITKEHLIPECLGGKLTAEFLCKDCNSQLGYGAESLVREDPKIRLEIERLASKRPDLADKLRQGLEYIGHSEQGALRGYMQNEEFIVKRKQLGDGSLIVRPGESLDHVRRMAKREDRGLLFRIDNDLDHLSSGESVEAAPGIEITNWIVDSVKPDLSRPVIAPVVPAKIAFEFLALHSGDKIYENPPQIASIRRQLLAGELSEGDIQVKRLIAQNERLFNGLAFEGNDPGAKVQIRLFGQLAFRVQFRQLAIHCPRWGYTHDLISGEDDLWAVEQASEDEENKG